MRLGCLDSVLRSVPMGCRVDCPNGSHRRLSNCLGASVRDQETYSAKGLASLMGVDPSVVARWIEKEGLTAARTDGGQYRVSSSAVRKWIIQHPGLVNLAKVHKEWFVDLLGSR
jgi:excisionase family DNA binding protein